jgi:hypothetical protein
LGKLIPRKEMEFTVKEIVLNQLCRNCILHEYPTDNQLNNITDAILEISDLLNFNGQAVNKLKAQRDYIHECMEINKKYKEAYKNDPEWTYISEDETDEYIREHMISCEELGIHSIDI